MRSRSARGSSCTSARSTITPRARGARSARPWPARGCTGWTPIGWGSFMGMSAALLAEAGFTGLRSQGLDAFDVASLGRDWQLLNVYVKPYPCCRWSQPALDAAVALHPLLVDRGISAVEIHTFAAADQLSTRR